MFRSHATNVGTQLSVLRGAPARAAAIRLTLLGRRTLGFLIARATSRVRLMAMVVAIVMFFDYWHTIGDGWSDRTRPTAATKAVELERAFCSVCCLRNAWAEPGPRHDGPEAMIDGQQSSSQSWATVP